MTEIDFETLKKKAWEHKRIAEYAVADELYDQAMLNWNFALEMLMKSVLQKEGITYTKTHDLHVLSECRNSRGVKIRSIRLDISAHFGLEYITYGTLK